MNIKARVSSCFGKKKPTQVVSKKVDGYYEKFHSINFELDGILEFNKAAIQNQRRNGIINYFFFFQDHISYLIETVNRIEESLGLRKLEFDVRRIWPVRSTNSSYLLEKCHHIESFLYPINHQDYIEKILPSSRKYGSHIWIRVRFCLRITTFEKKTSYILQMLH